MSESVEQHREAASENKATISIITVSDTRTPETDKNGIWLKEQVVAIGCEVADYQLIKDDPSLVVSTLKAQAEGDANVILFNGGTGIAKRDNTIDAITPLLEKEMPGFGEIFRMLSYEQVGAAAMLSRAIAGVYQGKVVICTPGSHAAVTLAWEKLIAPEINHLAWEVGR